MPSNSDVTSGRTRMAAPTVTLKSWPPRDEPRSWIVLGLGFAAAIAAGQITGRWATGALILGLILAATWQFWVPVTFELGSKGVIRRVMMWRQRVAWSEFSQYETHSHGVFLRHHSDQMPFGVLNGLFLPSRPPHTDLMTVLDYYLKSRTSDPTITTQTLVP
jgi:hypothetical protein